MIMYNDIEAEVDAIRDKIYITTKKMTSQERVEYINSRARTIMQKHEINDWGSIESRFPLRVLSERT